MGNRNAYPSQTLGGNTRVYHEFELTAVGGTVALVVSTDAAPYIASITRTGVGVNVITLKDSYTKVVAKSADVDDSLNDGAYATIAVTSGEGTSSPIVLTVYTRTNAGAVQDLTAGRRVGFQMAFRNGLGGGVR